MSNDPPPPEVSKSSSGLFRMEAMEHAGARMVGTVIPLRPIGHSILALVFSAIAIVLVSCFTLLSYTRRVHATGVLLPKAGLDRVLAIQAGVIAELRVQEGQRVAADDILFVLKNDRAIDAQVGAESRISSLLRIRHESLLDEQKQLHAQTDERSMSMDLRHEGLRRLQRKGSSVDGTSQTGYHLDRVQYPYYVRSPSF